MYSYWDVLEAALAREHRQILSAWRALLYLRLAEEALPRRDRRWDSAPKTMPEMKGLLRRLERAGSVSPLEGGSGLYRVNNPFARQNPLDEREVLFELNPFAALSHLSALAFHHLTELFPQDHHLLAPAQVGREVLPLGTRREDWDLISSAVRPKTPVSVLGLEIHWHRLKGPRVFGLQEFAPTGLPLRVTSRERTLVDGLARPDWSGGFANVLSAFRIGWESLDLELLCDFTEWMGVEVLKQRAGFLLERMGFRSPRLDRWAAASKRGGSSRLVAHLDFSPLFSERWSLSLNAPLGLLDEVLPP